MRDIGLGWTQRLHGGSCRRGSWRNTSLGFSDRNDGRGNPRVGWTVGERDELRAAAGGGRLCEPRQERGAVGDGARWDVCGRAIGGGRVWRPRVWRNVSCLAWSRQRSACPDVGEGDRHQARLVSLWSRRIGRTPSPHREVRDRAGTVGIGAQPCSPRRGRRVSRGLDPDCSLGRPRRGRRAPSRVCLAGCRWHPSHCRIVAGRRCSLCLCCLVP